MPELIIHLKCNPPKSTHQAGLRIIRCNNGRQFIGRYQKGASKQAQDNLMTMLEPYAPAMPIQGPVEMSVRWAYPFNKTAPERLKTLGWYPCATRPDCDNLQKGLCDIMTRLRFWNDDSQVWHIQFQKVYDVSPCIDINVTWHEI